MMFIHVNQQQSVVGDTAQKLRYVHNIKTGSAHHSVSTENILLSMQT